MQSETNARVEALIREIQRDNCVVFVGAGLSKEAGVGFSSGSDLVRTLAREGEKLNPTFRYSEHYNDRLENIAQDFAKIADHYSAGQGRRKLLEILQREVPRTGRRRYEAKRGSYQFIVNIPQLSDVIITTNWDELLEDVIQKYTDRMYAVLTPELDISSLKQPNSIKVVKLHGTISQPDTIRITKEDFYALIEEVDKAGTLMSHIGDLLVRKTVIFAGYSLKDPDFEFICTVLQRRAQRDKSPRWAHYAIVTHIPEYEEADWRSRGIVVIKMSAREFFAKAYRETSQFINRDEERKLEMLEYYPYYEVNGYAGLGKSTLLRRIADDLEVGGIGLSAFVRWPYYRFPPKDALDPVSRVDDFQKEISRAVGGRVESLRDLAAESAIESEKAGLPFKPVEEIFWEIVQKKTNRLVDSFGNKTLLLVDTTSTLHEEIRGVLERILLRARELHYPLYAIVASRYSMPWGKFKLKRLFHRERLPAFQVHDIAGFIRFYAVLNADEYLEPQTVSRAAHELEEITQGHPGAIKVVLDAMTEEKEAAPFTNREMVEYIRRHKADLAHLVVSEVVEKILQDLEELAREALKDKLCIFRRINHSVLQDLGYTNEESAFLIRDLEKVELAKRSGREVLWVLDPIVRRILALDLKLNKRTDFDQLNNRAGEIFEGKIRIDSPMPLAGTEQVEYMIEALYHHLVGWQTEQKDQEETKNQLKEKLDEYLEILRPSLIQTMEDVTAGLRMAILDDQEMLDLMINVCGEEAEEIVLSITVQERPVEGQEV